MWDSGPRVSANNPQLRMEDPSKGEHLSDARPQCTKTSRSTGDHLAQPYALLVSPLEPHVTQGLARRRGGGRSRGGLSRYRRGLILDGFGHLLGKGLFLASVTVSFLTRFLHKGRAIGARFPACNLAVVEPKVLCRISENILDDHRAW